MRELPQHLGGHAWKTHIDRGLIDHMIANHGVSSCLDVGCGPGGVVDMLNDLGVCCVGVDGDFRLERKHPERFLLHDFTVGTVSLDRDYDWGYSCEFLEHVEEKYIGNFMPAFQQCRLLTVTHATPGMAGHHHVNLREDRYWVEVFEEWGFTHDAEETHRIREVSTMNLDRPPHQRFFQNTGLFFRNNRT